MFFPLDEPLGSVKDRVGKLQSVVLAKATGGIADPADYYRLRESLMQEHDIEPLLPSFIRNCRTLDQFGALIKTQFSTYNERRTHIWDEFKPIFDRLESSPGPQAAIVSEVLANLDADHVRLHWQRALNRVESEPDAAITSARTMLESLFKLVLDQGNIEYSNNADLPKLYRMVAEKLQFTPEQQSDKSLKAVSGNIQNIVGQLAFLRNNFSDAHGQGQEYYRPTPEIAEFIVNLAGSLAIVIARLSQNSKGAAE